MSRARVSDINLQLKALDSQLATLRRRESEFQRLLDEMQRMKDEVSSERKAAEKKRAILEAEKNPINWLPTELLIHIFLSCAELDSGDSNIRSPVTISHVCMKWRAVALSTQRLWGRIIIPGLYSTDEVLNFIIRSERFPLELDYKSVKDILPSRECYYVSKLLSTTSSHFDRLERLAFRCKVPVAIGYLMPFMNDISFPRLRHLNLAITNSNPSFLEALHLLDKEKSLLKKTAPPDEPITSNSTLLHLRLQQVPLFNFPNAFIANLRSLELLYAPKLAGLNTDQYYLRMSSLCRFLKLTPLLEELILTNTVPYCDVTFELDENGQPAENTQGTLIPMNPIVLDHLKIIDWSYPNSGDVYRLLSMIDAPVLEKLDIWVEDLPAKSPQRETYPAFIRSTRGDILYSPAKYMRNVITYPCLKDISLQCAGEDSAACILHKFSLPSLEKIAFANVDSAARIPGRATPPLPTFPRLESLFRDPRLTNLTHLTLSHFKITSESGRVEATLGYMPVLTSLSLDSCLGVGRLMKGLQEPLIGVTKSSTTLKAARQDKVELSKGDENTWRGIKFCPRLEALSFWECQDFDISSLRLVINSRNGIANTNSGEKGDQAGVDTPNGATQLITRGMHESVVGRKPDELHMTLGRKIKPLRKTRRHVTEFGSPLLALTSLDGAVNPTTNIVSNIRAREEALRPANIIYLRIANCRLIAREDALSFRDLGVVDVIWA